MRPGIPDSYQNLPESDSGSFRYTRSRDYRTPTRHGLLGHRKRGLGLKNRFKIHAAAAAAAATATDADGGDHRNDDKNNNEDKKVRGATDQYDTVRLSRRRPLNEHRVSAERSGSHVHRRTGRNWNQPQITWPADDVTRTPG